MTDAQGKAEIRSLLERHGHRPNKSLGQHFLGDPNLVARIVRTAGVGPGDKVVEVGAGTGTLTKALAATGAVVVAYEVDRHLQPLLDEALQGVDVDMRLIDVTTIDLASDLGDGPWVMVANLPYNVGTPLVLDVLRGVPAVVRFIVMVQREVADRMVARPGSRVYGLPSVIVALRSNARVAFGVGRDVFYPRPDVESAVVVVERKEPAALVDRAEVLAAAAFGQRRKMLRRSLRSALVDPDATMRRAGIDPAARPETLAPEQFVDLATAEES
jgi:16S rRNA (adenine1518-N6/adenine1519-N6)-dimethyltransferase